MGISRRNSSRKILRYLKIFWIVVIFPTSLFVGSAYRYYHTAIQQAYVSPNALNLKLPSSSSKTIAPPTISIAVKPDGTFYYDNELATLTEIEKRLGAEKEKASNPKSLTVSIQTDPDTKVENVVSIMDLALQLNIGAILATEAD